MKKILWSLLRLFDSNRGYSTQLQQRFKKGDKVKIGIFKHKDTKYRFGEKVTIIEAGRHDYIVENSAGKRFVVYQFELE